MQPPYRCAYFGGICFYVACIDGQKSRNICKYHCKEIKRNCSEYDGALQNETQSVECVLASTTAKRVLGPTTYKRRNGPFYVAPGEPVRTS